MLSKKLARCWIRQQVRLQTAVDAAGDFLADLPETAGSGIQAGCSALKAIPPVVVFLRWLGRCCCRAGQSDGGVHQSSGGHPFRLALAACSVFWVASFC